MFFYADKTMCLVLFALCGIPWATVMVIPFAIVSRIAGPTRSGLFIGVLNISVVLPQLLVSAFSGLIVEAYRNNVTIALLIGGIFAFLAAIMVFFLIVDKSDNTTEANITTNPESSFLIH